jgi:hypothetical protein
VEEGMMARVRFWLLLLRVIAWSLAGAVLLNVYGIVHEAVLGNWAWAAVGPFPLIFAAAEYRILVRPQLLYAKEQVKIDAKFRDIVQEGAEQP